MNTSQLTEHINVNIDGLKTEVNKLKTGGCLQSLKMELRRIEQSINNFIHKIDELEQEREVHDGTKQKST